MLRLDRTTRSLGIVLGGAITTNQLQVIVSGVDRVPTSAAMQAPVIGFTQISTTNSTTDVTICDAPGATGRVREVQSISVRNRDTAAAVVSIEYDDNGTDYVIFSATLSIGDFLVYSSESGWQVFDSTGQLKVSSTFSVGMVIGDAVTGGTDTRVLFTKTGPVLGDDTNFTYNYTTDVLTVNGSTFGTNTQIGGTFGVTGVLTATTTIVASTTIEVGHATDTTLARVAAGRASIETLGIVRGPGSATDNAVTRFDATTGDLVQNSSFIVDDSGQVTSFGGNITFPATQAASAGANTLDDYEEGTWTPTLTFATPGDLSIVYSSRLGTYTKIGRLISLVCEIITSTFTHTTASGAFETTGAPFAAQGTTGVFYAGAMLWQGVTKAGYTQLNAQFNNGGSIIYCTASGSGVGQSTVTATDTPTGGAVVDRFTLSYEA